MVKRRQLPLNITARKHGVDKRKKANGRYGALESLQRFNKSFTPIKPILDNVSRQCGLPERERGLMMNIVYGVVRHRQSIDHLITKLSRHPLKKLDPTVYAALQVGLYQLYYLDRIPESAAVNETVNSLKTAGKPKRLQGFVNGILRESIRQQEKLTTTILDGDKADRLTNHPDWMTSRWSHRFGREEAARICKTNNQEPLITLRTNSCRIQRDELIARIKNEGIAAEPGQFAPDAILLPDYRGIITTLPGYKKGLFQPQNQAAQLATLLLSPFKKDGLYLDCCAGLGGKTSHLLQCVRDLSARVEAVEPEHHRQQLFYENIERLSADAQPILHKTTIQNHAVTTTRKFSGLLIDAPCSGTGVIGRQPDIRWNRVEDDIMKYQQVQLDILHQSAGLVKENGLLVYATCSLEQEENQDVIHTFLKERDDFTLTDCAPILPAAAHRFVHDKFFCPHPEREIDGFFAARLQRI